MAVNNPYQTYQNQSVATANPGELTLMLYNGCLKFIRMAKLAIEQKSIAQSHENIIKAQNIIQELAATLNPVYEISGQLAQLYDYIERRLVEANIRKDTGILNEVEELVTELRNTWSQAMKLAKKGE